MGEIGKMGKIFWQDLTVENAEQVKDFYCSVVGWTFENVNQGEYNDFNIINTNDNNEIVAGICHKKGEIKNFPSQWLNYVIVENIEISVEKCKSLGGKIIEGPKLMGKSKFVIIQDPAGAYLALMEN